jgi:hypothetical protein
MPSTPLFPLQLLQYGANIHHVNSKADGGSALHEAVAHKHEAVVELLLAHGGNPFVENIKGFTSMDIACSTRNVPLLRRLEQCAPYVGWLLMKVPQFGGLGSSWQRRWVVVSHRYPNPKAPPARQLTHCVFLAYKTLASTAPSCRVWLDGARAREVYNPKAEARLQSYATSGPRIAQVRRIAVFKGSICSCGWKATMYHRHQADCTVAHGTCIPKTISVCRPTARSRCRRASRCTASTSCPREFTPLVRLAARLTLLCLLCALLATPSGACRAF